jgi:putative copper export protein
MILPLLSRWIHIISATALVGGIIFFRYVVIPVGESSLSGDVFKEVRDKLARRFQLVSHITLLLFLVTGFYNYIVVTIPQHRDQSLYHMLFGIKFTAAIVTFVLAIMLTSRRERGEKLRENGRRWFGILLLVALATVMLGGVMKMLPRTDLAPVEPAVTTENEA